MTVTATDPAIIRTETAQPAAIAALERRVSTLEGRTGYIGAGALRGSAVLAAGSVITASLQAGSVTADKIDVASLDAITATMGSLNVNGTLTIGGAGVIRTTVGNQVTEFSAAGVKSTNAATGDVSFNLSSATGILTARMVIQTGTQMPLGFMGGNNLAPNSSAERPDGSPTPFAAYSSNGSVALTTSTDQAWHGLRSFKVNGSASTSTHSFGLMQAELNKIVPNTTHTLSAYVYSPISEPYFIYSRRLNAAGTAEVGSSTSSSQVVPANKWTRISQTFTSEAGAYQHQLYVWTSTLTQRAFYVDGIQLETGEVPTAYHPRDDEILPGSVTINELAALSVSTAQLQADAVTTVKLAAGAVTASKITMVISGNNLLKNAGFAAGGAGGTPPVWINFGASSMVQQPGANTVAWPGYVQVIASGAGLKGIYQDAPIDASARKFSAQVSCLHPMGSAATALIYIDWYGAGGSLVGTTARYFSIPSGVWTAISTDVADVNGSVGPMTAPAGAISARMLFWFESVPDAVSTYWCRPKLEVGEKCSGWSQGINPTVIDGDSVTAATIIGGTITGALFRTATSGNRIEFDTSGVRLYEPDGVTVALGITPGTGLRLLNATGGGSARRQIQYVTTGGQVVSTITDLGSSSYGDLALIAYDSSGNAAAQVETNGAGSSSNPSIALLNIIGTQAAMKIYPDGVTDHVGAHVVLASGQHTPGGSYTAGYSYALLHSNYSDRRTKRNIRPWGQHRGPSADEGAPDDTRLMRLRELAPKVYDRVDGGGFDEIGFIAQDVAAIAPEAVERLVASNGDTLLMLNPIAIDAILANALQATDQRVARLEQRLADLAA